VTVSQKAAILPERRLIYLPGIGKATTQVHTADTQHFNERLKLGK
jgi:hypothetical protein